MCKKASVLKTIEKQLAGLLFLVDSEGIFFSSDHNKADDLSALIFDEVIRMLKEEKAVGIIVGEYGDE